MGKRKLETIKEENINIDFLVEEIDSTNEELKKIEINHGTETNDTEMIDNVDKKWLERIKLSEDGELTQSVKYLKKLHQKSLIKYIMSMKKDECKFCVDFFFIAFTLLVIVKTICLWQLWKIISLTRILERYNGRVGKGLLRENSRLSCILKL